MALMVAFTSLPVFGAEAGAWETFSTQANANAWTVYDYGDETNYLPSWSNAVPDDEDIYFYHTGDNAVWFFTGVDENAGGGRLVGDYQIENVQGISCDVEIGSLDHFDYLDCVIYTTGSHGAGYYYSASYVDTDFTEAGWWSLSFSLGENWFYYDENEGYLPVEVTPSFLSSIEEIGFRFFLKVGTTEEIVSAIDNVKLIPKVAPAEVETSQSGTEFQMTFTPGNGISCAIEKMLTTPVIDWEPVVGQEHITGVIPHLFTAPLADGSGFYRVRSSAHYIPIVTDAK